MSAADTIRRVLGLPAPPPPSVAKRAPGDTASGLGRALAGGRLSRDDSAPIFSSFLSLIPPPTHEDNWRTLNLDADTLDRIAPARLLELLADLSPEVSRALWDFLRLCNPGWEVVATRPTSDQPETEAQAAIDAFLSTLADRHGSVDVMLSRLFIGVFLRGALFAEIVLDQDGRTPIDLATPDPQHARFRKVDDPVLGVRWQLCQWQATTLRDLDRPTVRYVPVDPLPGSPYGRPLASPALFLSLFLLGLLHDLRRVVAQQGYQRLDLEIVAEKLLAAMPPDLARDPDAVKDWAAAAIQEVSSVYATLEPDDAYVHLDVVKVNKPVGAVNADSMGAVDGLLRALERMAVRALKSMPFAMGLSETTTETQANRQWELQAASIKAIQHLTEQLLEHLLGLALRAQGLQAEVHWRFAELRASEMLRDAQTEALQIANARSKRDEGWWTQDEAALAVVGHPAVVATPLTAPAADPTAASAGGVNGDPGSNRGRRPMRRTGVRDAALDMAAGLEALREALADATEDALAAFLGDQASRVAARLTQGRSRAANDVPSADELVPPEEEDLLRAVLDEVYVRTLGDTAALTQSLLKISFQLDDPATRQFLRDAGENIVGITQTTRDAVRAALIEGQAAGESYQQLANRLRALPQFGRTRARTVAVTELAQASNRAALTSYEASGGVVVGVLVFDGDYDAACAAMNGRRYTLAAARGVPPLQHPRCLVGDSLVIAPNVDASFARWFDGEVIVLRTAADDLLTCTPNHPILTPRGWVAAGDLTQGDDVIRSLDGERISRLLDPDHDYRPTRIQQIADALGPAGGGTSTAMPCAPEDFHGDGAGSDVYVVRTDGLAEGHRETSLREHVGQGSVIRTDVTPGPFTADGLPAQVVEGLRAPADGGMGGGDQRRAAVRPESRESQAHGLGSVGLLADGAKPAAGSSGVHAKPRGDLGHRQSVDGGETGVLPLGAAVTTGESSLPELAHERGFPDADAYGDLLASLAGLVAPVEVVEVQRWQFSGHVYNLETAQGWYIADNILTHNCRRALAPITDAAELEAAA